MSLMDQAAAAVAQHEDTFEATVREVAREVLGVEPEAIKVHRPSEFAGDDASAHPMWAATFTIDGLHFGVRQYRSGEPRLLLMHDAESVPGRYSCVAQINSLVELGALLAADAIPE